MVCDICYLASLVTLSVDVIVLSAVSRHKWCMEVFALNFLFAVLIISADNVQLIHENYSTWKQL